MMLPCVSFFGAVDPEASGLSAALAWRPKAPSNRTEHNHRVALFAFFELVEKHNDALQFSTSKSSATCACCTFMTISWETVLRLRTRSEVACSGRAMSPE